MPMISSMTGYGRASAVYRGSRIQAELRSVNHRFCEISIKMPRQLMTIEDKIKKAISGRIRRGRVEAYITIGGEPISRQTLTPDWELLDQAAKAAAEMKKRYGLEHTVSADGLMRIEGAFAVQEEYEEQSGLDEAVLRAAEQAAAELQAMRQAEGRHLLKDISGRLDEVRAAAGKMKAAAPAVRQLYMEKLSQKMIDLLQSKADEQRILTEAAVFAEKADISEEVTRIYSHLEQFGETLELEDAVGRKLDFIVQELNREANTIASKANDSKVSRHAVELKSIIEKIREQVQNVE
ncbi:YicC/YloC family endoribonuclease [Metabacillus mangrovi]|nr:YicC/YloC family endoribonuclease [Metabacillus mangrovi]